MNEPTIPPVRLDWSGAVVVELRHAIRSDLDWSGAVVVELRHAIRSDMPFRGPEHQAPKGRHDGWCNPNGAISVETAAGMLGVKPAECLRWRYTHDDVWFRWLRCAWAPECVAGREEGP